MIRLSKLTDSESISEGDDSLKPSITRVTTLFQSQFSKGIDIEVALGFVPGRVEVAGKHTDYAGGHTLVCAIEKGFLFVAAANAKSVIRIVEDSSEFAPLEFPFTENLERPAGRWANYPMTMAQRLAHNFGREARLSGVDVAFTSDLPVGSGMSGSSALMMMCFCAIALVNRLHETPTFASNIYNNIDLAMYLACAENGQSFRGLPGGKGVGTFGGSEDHTAILNCKAGLLSLYQYAPTAFKADVAWPSDWALVLAFSGVRAEKTGEALEKYNLASRRAALAVDVFNHTYGKKLHTLSEIQMEMRSASSGTWLNALKGSDSAQEGLDLPSRVRQFLLEERETTPRAFQGLVWRNLEAFGNAVSASHRASRRLLWNIAPEVDFLQKTALKLGAAGASGFGAGFGGSIFAVTRTGNAEEFASTWRQEYVKRYPKREKESAFFLAKPSPGIRIWDERGPSRFVDTIFES